MNNFQKALYAPALAVAILLGYSSVAGATTETAVTGGFTDLQSLFVTTIAPAIFALIIAVVGVTMGIKWLRRGSAA